MAITVDKQTIKLDAVTSITISEIVADEVGGGYVRKLLFFTESLDAANRTADLEIVLTADSNNSLKVATPELEF